MAAAYAALVSLLHTIEQIQHHLRPPVWLDQNQVQSLQEKVAFLQDFLEDYSHRLSQEHGDDLMVRIADAAHAAEDVIESGIVDQILDQPTSRHGGKMSSIDHFYQDLQNEIAHMELIKKEVIEIKGKMGLIRDHLHRDSVPAGSLSSSTSMGQKQAMVGIDDVLNEIMDKLTGQYSSRRIIPIVGMGGIGKTTLARNVCQNPLIVQYFDIRAWVTVSQEYSTRQVLLELNLDIEKDEGNKKRLRQKSEELGEILYKRLSGARYLIIMDDMWTAEVWDNVKFFFPNNNCESRIMITTRLSNLALQITGSHGLKMNFLDEDESWDLLCKTVFGEEGNCALELEEIGRKIAKHCKGLPLSIVVIGGLLAKSKQTRDYWEYIVENLSSIVSLEDNERCLRILYTSYHQLPVHLKPCFLYMRVFPEDRDIRVSQLIKLWVAEGFLKPISGKSMEEVAEKYFKDLIDRNLILVRKFGFSGRIRFCNVHDLLRDLCLKEAQKEKFLCCHDIRKGINAQRRIVVHQNASKGKHDISQVLQSAPLARSLICDFQGALVFDSLRLLRVLNVADSDGGYSRNQGLQDEYSSEAIFKLVNSRYLAFRANLKLSSGFHSSLHLLWNLQTVIVKEMHVIDAPPEIWKLHQLRHVQFYWFHLPDPPSGDEFVLENLQTMSSIINFKCGEDVVKRIPNIKKLRIGYDDFSFSRYCLQNLERLHKLESLACTFQSRPRRSLLLNNLSFPHSLRKLNLYRNGLHWEDVATKIGSLPFLEVLKLFDAVMGPKWETVEGQFCSLKVLLIDGCYDLKYWTTESSHFPCLEHLILIEAGSLEEFPPGIGEIPTLQTIQLIFCSSSTIITTKRIVEEQEELGNADLYVLVKLSADDSELTSLASNNFQFEIGQHRSEIRAGPDRKQHLRVGVRAKAASMSLRESSAAGG
ncbi:UNVERIFIED_CONTAM: putative late blight resistance proteinR1B-14 [Sesamum radiatum]|uniref:Late blight resistance proteinR1B-14 n=1 Tax=Sesamum radiatum TaxID=300843 RepID=A0AAW2PIR0_SESRA